MHHKPLGSRAPPGPPDFINSGKEQRGQGSHNFIQHRAPPHTHTIHLSTMARGENIFSADKEMRRCYKKKLKTTFWCRTQARIRFIGYGNYYWRECSDETDRVASCRRLSNAPAWMQRIWLSYSDLQRIPAVKTK